eukprot:11220948-Lingulodinium_polyedra.AAC.1
MIPQACVPSFSAGVAILVETVFDGRPGRGPRAVFGWEGPSSGWRRRCAVRGGAPSFARLRDALPVFQERR